MKSFIFTLLILASAFAAYDYFGAPPGEKLLFTDLNKVAEEPVAPAVSAPPETAKPVAPVVTAPVAPAPAVPAPTAAPAVVAAPSAPAKPVAEANGFLPPNFDPIEKLTGNWLKIPSSAFPRQVKLAKPTLFKMSVGGSQMAAGATVTAISASEGMLTLAPAVGSTARAVAPIDDTDLKSTLNTIYDNWKPIRIEQLRKAYERRLAAAKAPPPAAVESTAASGVGVDGGGKPTRDANGTYPLLLASIKSGQVTEITGESILYWGEAAAANVEGKPAWSIPVKFNANTVFGKIEAEAQAVVQNGRVKGWFYTGSGEEVP